MKKKYTGFAKKGINGSQKYIPEVPVIRVVLVVSAVLLLKVRTILLRFVRISRLSGIIRKTENSYLHRLRLFPVARFIGSVLTGMNGKLLSAAVLMVVIVLLAVIQAHQDMNRA